MFPFSHLFESIFCRSKSWNAFDSRISCHGGISTERKKSNKFFSGCKKEWAKATTSSFIYPGTNGILAFCHFCLFPPPSFSGSKTNPVTFCVLLASHITSRDLLCYVRILRKHCIVLLALVWNSHIIIIQNYTLLRTIYHLSIARQITCFMKNVIFNWSRFPWYKDQVKANWSENATCSPSWTPSKLWRIALIMRWHRQCSRER